MRLDLLTPTAGLPPDGRLRLVGYQEVVGICSVELCQQLMEGLRQRHLAEESRQDVIQTSTRQTFQPQQVKFEMFL